MSPPIYVASIFNPFKNTANCQTRNPRPYTIPLPITAKYKSSPVIKLIDIWNTTPSVTRQIPNISQFKCKISFKIHGNKIISTTQISKNINRKEEICLNRLRVDLLLTSQLFNHNFRDVTSPNCTYCNKINNIYHFLVKCQRPSHRTNLDHLHNALGNIDHQILDHFNTLTIKNKTEFLLYGDQHLFKLEHNIQIISITAKFTSENHDKHTG